MYKYSYNIGNWLEVTYINYFGSMGGNCTYHKTVYLHTLLNIALVKFNMYKIIILLQQLLIKLN